jgi:hypothetical protein
MFFYKQDLEFPCPSKFLSQTSGRQIHWSLMHIYAMTDFLCYNTFRTYSFVFKEQREIREKCMYYSIVLVMSYTCFPFQGVAAVHRVDRVLSFLSSRPNCELGLPDPLNAGVVYPPPLVGGGEGAHSLPRKGGGGAQFQRGDRHCGTLGIKVLCGLHVYIETLSENSDAVSGKISRISKCFHRSKQEHKKYVSRHLRFLINLKTIS